MSRMAIIALLLVLLMAASECGGGAPGSTPPPTGGASITTSPTSAAAGSSDLILTITGSHFAGDLHSFSQVAWTTNSIDDTLLATTFVSDSQLKAVIPANLLTQPVMAQVSVLTGDPMADRPTSVAGPIFFGVQSGLSASPTSVVAGSPDLSLTLTGAGFTAQGSQVLWTANGRKNALATTFISSTQLIAVIPAALLENPVTAQVFVETGDPMGDIPLLPTNSINFEVTAAIANIPSRFVLAAGMNIARSDHTATLLV